MDTRYGDKTEGWEFTSKPWGTLKRLPDCRICGSILEVLTRHPNGLGLNDLAVATDVAKGTCRKHLEDLKTDGLVVAFSGKGGKEPNFAFRFAWYPLDFWSEEFWVLKVTIEDVGDISREVTKAATPESRRALILDVVKVISERHQRLFDNFLGGTLDGLKEWGAWSEEFDELYHVVQGGYEEVASRFLTVCHIKQGEIGEAQQEWEDREEEREEKEGHNPLLARFRRSPLYSYIPALAKFKNTAFKEDDLPREWRNMRPLEIKRLIDELIEKALPKPK